MRTGRRSFLAGVAACVSGIHALAAGAQQRQAPSRTSPLPDASSPSPDDTPIPPRAADPKVLLKEEQKELRRDVDRLLQMAKELKEESDKTPETDVLSLSLVKKAEDIEKLARQIKDRIRQN